MNIDYDKLLSNAMKIARNRDTAQEVLSMCLLSFLEMNGERQDEIISGGKMENYITKCVSLNINSSTSPYHRLHRKYDFQTTPLWEDYDYRENDDFSNLYEERCECVERAVENLHWYDRVMIQRKFYDGWTFAKMNEYYNISLNSLVKDVHIALDKIKNECKNGN